MSNVMKSAQEAQPEEQAGSLVSTFVKSLYDKPTAKGAPPRKGTIESYNTAMAIEEEIINSDI
jgi:hypothetical protein